MIDFDARLNKPFFSFHEGWDIYRNIRQLKEASTLFDSQSEKKRLKYSIRNSGLDPQMFNYFYRLFREMQEYYSDVELATLVGQMENGGVGIEVLSNVRYKEEDTNPRDSFSWDVSKILMDALESNGCTVTRHPILYRGEEYPTRLVISDDFEIWFPDNSREVIGPALLEVLKHRTPDSPIIMNPPLDWNN